MKAILEFKLPEDKIAFDNACKADSMFLFLQFFDNFLNDEINNFDRNTKKETMRLEMVREQFYDYLKKNEISIK